MARIEQDSLKMGYTVGIFTNTWIHVSIGC